MHAAWLCSLGSFIRCEKVTTHTRLAVGSAMAVGLWRDGVKAGGPASAAPRTTTGSRASSTERAARHSLSQKLVAACMVLAAAALLVLAAGLGMATQAAEPAAAQAGDTEVAPPGRRLRQEYEGLPVSEIEVSCYASFSAASWCPPPCPTNLRSPPFGCSATQQRGRRGFA